MGGNTPFRLEVQGLGGSYQVDGETLLWRHRLLSLPNLQRGAKDLTSCSDSPRDLALDGLPRYSTPPCMHCWFRSGMDKRQHVHTTSICRAAFDALLRPGSLNMIDIT